jgi:hypothetical protein
VASTIYEHSISVQALIAREELLQQLFTAIALNTGHGEKS